MNLRIRIKEEMSQMSWLMERWEVRAVSGRLDLFCPLGFNFSSLRLLFSCGKLYGSVLTPLDL